MNEKLNILIAAVQVPFTRGGAELLVENLVRELKKVGHVVDIVQLPFTAQPNKVLLKQISLWRSLEIRSFAGREVDLVITTKFPSYMINHPKKVVWLIHQHRQFYELYGSRFGDPISSDSDEEVRQMVYQADFKALSESRAIYTISQNVSSRLSRYLDLQSKVLTPPLPLGDQYYTKEPEPYILSVGRICSIKRVDMLIKALPRIDDRLKIKIVGEADEPAMQNYIDSEINKHHLWHRVEFLGRVEDQILLALYAKAFAVYYAPFDEDYGFVTLEALASNKPVLTAYDSGGVLEFVEHEKNGLIVDPNERSVADGFNRMLNDPELYKKLVIGTTTGLANSSWGDIVGELTAMGES